MRTLLELFQNVLVELILDEKTEKIKSGRSSEIFIAYSGIILVKSQVLLYFE